MNKATGLFIFVLGAAVGSTVTWRYTKAFYEQRAQEEINSVKEVFLRKSPDVEINNIVEKEAVKVEKFDMKPDISEYVKKLENEKYVTSDSSPTVKTKACYVISPDEFGEIDDYEELSLTYYADQVLADDNDEIINDVDDIVGMESLTHFGEYEDDSVFVRNDILKCDYEILMSARTYSEVLKEKPHQREV